MVICNKTPKMVMFRLLFEMFEQFKFKYTFPWKKFIDVNFTVLKCHINPMYGLEMVAIWIYCIFCQFYYVNVYVYWRVYSEKLQLVIARKICLISWLLFYLQPEFVKKTSFKLGQLKLSYVITKSQCVFKDDLRS